MNKTIHKQLTKKVHKTHASLTHADEGTVQFMNLMREMHDTLEEAAGELLQPRPQAITALLQKIRLS
jgi:hypothetical protein